MSIATLKRKSLSQINISSDGFSLHGSHRNLGYIGQSLAFHPDLCANQNDTSVLKNGSVNNHAMLSKRFPKSTHNVIKPDYNHNINTQQQYITNVRNKTFKEVEDMITDPTNPCYSSTPYVENKFCGVASVSHLKNRICKHYKKPEGNFVAMSQDEYMLQLKRKCIIDVPYLPTTMNKTPCNGCGKCESC